MMRLVLVELTRAVWRRTVLLLLAAMVVVPLVIGIFAITGHDSPDGRAEAVAQAERDAQKPETQALLRDCLDDPEQFIGTDQPGDAQAACEEAVLPQPDWYAYDVLDLEYERDTGSGFGVAVVVALIAMLVGTTFVGHDWNTGSMSNQLLFESRRTRVWLAKALAVTSLVGVTALLGTTAFWLLLASRFWTTGASIPDGVLLDGLQQGWRGAAVAAGAALGGYALTMLSRSTVFTLGVLFGVAVAGGILISLLVDDRGWVDPTLNATAVINDGTSYDVELRDCNGAVPSYDGEESCFETRHRSAAQGTTYLVLLVGVGSAASVLSYRRRDVP